ncbi:MAG TPA: fibronectin type III domain-containing protein [Acetobacteraceae bacterium]|nr:fibronectin type III domain-containing protein [Acetobacteraceae bacterium]
MANSRTPRDTNRRMAAIHTFGHPNAAVPRTRWAAPAHGQAGESAVSTIVAAPPPVLLPNPPNAPTLAVGTPSGLQVSWAAPAIDATHAAASGYNLQYSPSGAGTWTMLSNVASPYALTGLAAGTAFDVQVQATNAAGASAWSPASTLATAAAAPNPPNAPAVASVAPVTDGSVTRLAVIWTAPAVDGSHAAATGYNLRFSPSGAGTWTTVSGVSSPYTITGLTGASAIDVEVQATNAAPSPSAWSATVTGTTWGATVALGNWVPAASQVHNTSVAPSGGVNMTATPAPTAVTGAAFAWSGGTAAIPTSGLIAAGADGQNNGWGQWFNTPATAGTYYLWLIAEGAGGTTIGALVTAAITVT